MKSWQGWLVCLLVLLAGGLMLLIQLGSRVTTTYDRADPKTLKWFLDGTPSGSVHFATAGKDNYLKRSEVNLLNHRFYTTSNYVIGHPTFVAGFLTSGQMEEITQIVQTLLSKPPDNPFWYDFQNHLYLALSPSPHSRIYVWPKDKPVPQIMDRLLQAEPSTLGQYSPLKSLP